MAINRQKLKLLYLMRMLEEETDAERGLTMAQIIGKLEALGISAERKSIYRDIEALREFGVDVRTYQRAPGRTRSSAALEPAQAAALGDGLPVRRPGGSRYAYLAWEEDAGVLDALEALSARQKEALWRGFLQDGTQPMEFQWLWDAYREGAVDSLLEWELTLQLTLEALGFAVVNGAGRFTVTGPDGSARSFDLIRGGPAEKLFLKILFPLDKRE